MVHTQLKISKYSSQLLNDIRVSELLTIVLVDYYSAAIIKFQYFSKYSHLIHMQSCIITTNMEMWKKHWKDVHDSGDCT